MGYEEASWAVVEDTMVQWGGGGNGELEMS